MQKRTVSRFVVSFWHLLPHFLIIFGSFWPSLDPLFFRSRGYLPTIFLSLLKITRSEIPPPVFLMSCLAFIFYLFDIFCLIFRLWCREKWWVNKIRRIFNSSCSKTLSRPWERKDGLVFGPERSVLPGPENNHVASLRQQKSERILPNDLYDQVQDRIT